jgi:hypothetical protein
MKFSRIKEKGTYSVSLETWYDRVIMLIFMLSILGYYIDSVYTFVKFIKAFIAG